MTTAFIVMGTGLGQSDTLSVGAAQDGVCCWLADGQRPFDHFCADFWPVSGVLGAHCMTNSMAPDQAVRLQPGPMPSVVGSDQVDHVLMCVAGASDMLRAFLDNVAPLWIPEARISVLFSPRCSAWHRPCQSTCTAAGWLLTQNHICRASLSVCLTNLRWESYRPCAPLQAPASPRLLCNWWSCRTNRIATWEHQRRLGGTPGFLSVQTLPTISRRTIRPIGWTCTASQWSS